MLDTAKQFIQSANNIVIIQAENPDGDSLGSSLALEEVLSDLGKTVTLYCPVDIPEISSLHSRLGSGAERLSISSRRRDNCRYERERAASKGN